MAEQLENRHRPTLGLVLLVVTIGLLAGYLLSRTLLTSPGPEPRGPTAVMPITLPLTLDEVGLAGGQVEPNGGNEGPDAISYCNHRPSADGLVGWDGNRLKSAEGRHRLAQMVVHFSSSIHATAYLAANSAIIDCDSWRAGDDGTMLFSVAEVSPSRIYGDEAKQFELTVTTGDVDLYLRTVLVRSGADVAQFTMASPDPGTLDDLDHLVALATTKLGF